MAGNDFRERLWGSVVPGANHRPRGADDVARHLLLFLAWRNLTTACTRPQTRGLSSISTGLRGG